MSRSDILMKLNDLARVLPSSCRLQAGQRQRQFQRRERPNCLPETKSETSAEMLVPAASYLPPPEKQPRLWEGEGKLSATSLVS